MANANVLQIKIKAQLPVGTTLDEAHAALTIAKNAQETGDYSELLKAATVLDVSVDQKTIRVPNEKQEA